MRPGLVAEVEAWIAADPDPSTRAELSALLAAGDAEALEARFARPLEFGTAGLRGPVGAGPARMGRLVVRRTTSGLARWICRQAPAAGAAGAAGVVVGHDARRGSATFAADAAEVAAKAGLPVHAFQRALPTPLTAFAVRHLGAAAGVMITASHNPAADNGYKVYEADGAQLLPPHDRELAEAAAQAAATGAAPGAVARPGGVRRLHAAVERLDEVALVTAYSERLLELLDHDGPRELRVVYTPLHGVGGALAPAMLEAAGFAPPLAVPAQAEPDPDFPTVPFPNPEEPGALDLALAEAAAVDADIVLANDPDADRLAVAVPAPPGTRRPPGTSATGWRVLSGDELGALLADYLLSTTEGGDRLVATTIVSSSLLRDLAAEHGVDYAETLTGIKWIARAAAGRPGRRLLFGYEEALGYAVSDAVADKDGVSAAVLAAAMAAGARAEGASLLDRLDAIEARLGVHATAQWSLRLAGSDAGQRLAAVVGRWRADPPGRLAGIEASEVVDLARGARGLPPTDAVVIRLGDAGRVVIRPSGTEPKLKAYLEATTPPPGSSGLAGARAEAAALLAALETEVAARCRAG